jgi:hypothetical protein
MPSLYPLHRWIRAHSCSTTLASVKARAKMSLVVLKISLTKQIHPRFSQQTLNQLQGAGDGHA